MHKEVLFKSKGAEELSVTLIPVNFTVGSANRLHRLM